MCVCARLKSGSSALHASASIGDVEATHMLLEYIEKVNIYIYIYSSEGRVLHAPE